MAGTSVPIPDQDAQNFLDNARSQAVASLKGHVPDSMLQPLTTAPRAPAPGPGPSAIPPPRQMPLPAPDQPPPESAQPLSDDDDQAPPPPAPPPSPAAKPPEKTLGDRVWSFTQGALGQSNRALELIELAGATPLMLADKIHSAATGKDSTDLQDWYFKHTVDNTVANQNNFELDDKADLTDKVLNGIGSTLMMIDQAVATGGRSAAVETAFARTLPETLTAGAATMSAPAAIEAVDKGRQLLQATGDPAIATKGAAVAYVANVLAGLVPFGVGKRFVTKVVTAGLTSGAVGEAQRVAQNAALGPQVTDYQRRLMSDEDRKAANRIDAQRQPFDPQELLTSIITGAPLGAIHPIQDYVGRKVEEYKSARDLAKNPPPPAPPPGPMAEPVDISAAPPPGPPGVEGQEPPPPKPAPAPPPSEAAVPPGAPQVEAAAPVQGNAAQAPLGLPAEPVNGRPAGAGDGDTSTQTAAAGAPAVPTAPSSAAAKESAVAPAEAPTPVKEQPAASEVTPKPQGGKEPAPPVPTKEAGGETQETPPPAQVSEPESKLSIGRRALVRVGGEDVPVVIAGEAKDGKVPVRMVDDEGRIAKDIRQVPEHMFGQETEAPQAPAAEASPEPKAGEAKSETRTLPTDEQMRNAGLTAYEIQRMHSNPDYFKGDQIKAGYRHIAGEWRKPTAEDAALYRKGEAADQKEKANKKAALDKYWSENTEGRLPDGGNGLSRILGSDWGSGMSGSLKERSYQHLETAYNGWRGREADSIDKFLGASSKDSHPLKAAVDLFKQQNTPEPGKKFAGSVKEHAQRVGELARAVKAAAAADGVPDAVRAHAVEAAKRVERIDLKTDESMTHNRGVGHKMLDLHADDLLRAADNIMDPANAKIPEAPVQTKGEAFKAKHLKAREKASSERVSFKALKDAEFRMKQDYDTLLMSHTGHKRYLNSKAEYEKLKATYDAQRGRGEANATSTPDTNAPRAPTKGPKARAAQEAAAKERDLRTAPEAARAEDQKVRSAIPDVEDVTKPPKLTNEQQRDAQGAVQRYLKASDDSVAEAHDALEAKLSELYGPQRAHQVQDIMELVRKQREDSKQDPYTPKRMSETVDDDEFKGTHWDEGNDLSDEVDAHTGQVEAEDFLRNTPIGKLSARLNKTALWRSMLDKMHAGDFVSTHKVLDHILSVSHDIPQMHSLITKIREHVPDLPIRPVDVPVHPSTGEIFPAKGVFHARSNSIQVTLDRMLAWQNKAPFYTIHTLLHEIVHGATRYEQMHNPGSPFSREIKNLYEEAQRRQLAAIRKGEYGFEHYGLTDEGEFVAEALTNPIFQKWLADSEKYADNWQGLKITNLLGRLGRAIAEFFGAKDPRVSSLLQDVMGSTERLMEANANTLRARGMDPRTTRAADFLAKMSRESLAYLKSNASGISDEATFNAREAAALDRINALKDPPEPLPREEEFRSAVGDHATQIARLTRRAVRSGAVETIRQNARSFKTYSQLVREALRRGYFGVHDAQNPLRQYDEHIQERDAIINRPAHEVTNIVNDRAKLSYADDEKLGNFQIDSTMHGIDPEADRNLLPAKVTSDPKFEQRWQEMQDRWKNLTDAQRDIYRRERDMNEKLFRAERRAAVDVALDSYSDKEVPAPTRRLLYSVDNPVDFKGLIGPKGIVDVGERNDKLIESLQDIASTHATEGPYFHLGRIGDHVVQVTPEGTKTFATEDQARAFASKIENLSPNSKADVDLVGGKWQVDYKADYVSMHKSPAEADAEVARLRAAGLDVGSHTFKILSERNVALSGGVQNIIAEANRRLERNGSDNVTKELQETLRHTMVQMMAAKSSYAASKLARKNVGGVKGSEMGRNFAVHAQSMAYNTGHLATMFKLGEALGKLRDAVKDSSQPQKISDRRGRVYDEISRRLAQENQQFGQSAPFNSLVAKAGFMNYMMSFSHSLVYLTQNFTTAIPTAGNRYGRFKAMGAFRAAMGLVSSPAFREAFRAGTFRGDADSILKAVYSAVAKDERFGKWAQGENPPLQQLIDRGAIHTSLSNQLAEAAKGGGKLTNRVFEYARILPSTADLFNRVSTGLALLELTKGDVYRSGDFIKETHMDYSQGEKPRAFRAVGRLWGGNSVTMFRTYTQGMAHLLYSHIADMAYQTEGGRTQALMTVAGLMLGATAFAGIQRGFGIEPIRALMWAYNKIVGDNNEYYNFDNMSRRFVSRVVGENKLADVINGGLPRVIGPNGNGFDISSRLGLSDLFYHDPPDISSLDSSAWAKMAMGILGPGYQEVADQYHAWSNAFASGRVSDYMKALPIKMVRDVVNAYTSATEGATNARGIHLTDPSVWGAAMNAIGVKSAEQAKAQEQQNTDSDYRQWAENKKYQILQRYAEADPSDRNDIRIQAQEFSVSNPGHKISYQELHRAAVSLQRQQIQVDTGYSRDPVQNDLNDY